MFFQNVLLNKLNIVIVFQHLFKVRINAFKPSLNESFYVDNRNKKLFIFRFYINYLIIKA